ncbi:hypothetical protein MnTg02_02592 [bacterium MnTg02]|nr:hypothetical protein MnTg02_02592 [bacterium MnTg02]
MAPKMPTDLALLNEIYERNYGKFIDFSDAQKSRSSKIWLPIDIEDLARIFNLDSDIVFGRLYYHLNEKYSHQNSDGSKSEFFAIRVGSDHHCVNFPYLSSILASLRDEHTKFLTATGIAGFSLVISILSIMIAVIA